MGYGSAAYSGSAWEKSVAQSETGPVMTSLREPGGGSSSVPRYSWLKRSSTVMSTLLEDLDRSFGTVGHRQARRALVVRRHDPLADHLPVALVVLAEQDRKSVVYGKS